MTSTQHSKPTSVVDLTDAAQEIDLRSSEPAHLIEFGRNESIKLSAYGVVLSFLALAAGAALLGPSEGSGNSPWLFLAAAIATIVLHELVHGLFFKIFGGSPTYGAGISGILPYAYATSVGDRFTPRQMYAIGAAPLFLVTSLAVGAGLAFPAAVPYMLLAVVINVGGAIGDLWLMREMARFSGLSNVTFEDRRDGLAVFTCDPKALDISDELASRAGSASFGVRFIAAFAVCTFLTLLIPAFLAVMNISDPVRIGPEGFALFEYTSTSSEVAVELNLLPAMAAALLFAGLSHLRGKKEVSFS